MASLQDCASCTSVVNDALSAVLVDAHGSLGKILLWLRARPSYVFVLINEYVLRQLLSIIGFHQVPWHNIIIIFRHSTSFLLQRILHDHINWALLFDSHLFIFFIFWLNGIFSYVFRILLKFSFTLFRFLYYFTWRCWAWHFLFYYDLLFSGVQFYFEGFARWQLLLAQICSGISQFCMYFHYFPLIFELGWCHFVLCVQRNCSDGVLAARISLSEVSRLREFRISFSNLHV